MADNCVFCMIANGEIPSTTLFEDDDLKVIFDIGPVSKGHALVICKEHFENIYEIPDELLSKMMSVAKKTAIALKNETGCDGINILQNNEKAAGQTVYHVHIHVIPRFEGDKGIMFGKPGEADMDYLSELSKKVAKYYES